MAEVQAQPCTVCTHAKSAEIDAALLDGTPLRVIAGTFGVSRSAAGRHKTNHLTAEIAVQPGTSGPLDLVNVHRALSDVAARLEAVMAAAERSRKPATVVAAGRELRQVLETLGRLQADPLLAQAARGAYLDRLLVQGAFDDAYHSINFVLARAGLVSEPWRRLLGRCMRAFADADSLDVSVLETVDTTDVDRLLADREQSAKRLADAEVGRRVQAEVARRLAELRRPQPALPTAGVPVPVHDGPDAPVVQPSEPTARVPLEGVILPAAEDRQGNDFGRAYSRTRRSPWA